MAYSGIYPSPGLFAAGYSGYLQSYRLSCSQKEHEIVILYYPYVCDRRMVK
jgi:hypothetical protein